MSGQTENGAKENEPNHVGQLEGARTVHRPFGTLLRQMLPMLLVLAVPIVPFLLFHARIEQWAVAYRVHPAEKQWVAIGVAALLASDIFLPIPSSVVCTFAGAELGALLATFVTWLGMTIGALFGFALARSWGPRFVGWFSRPEDLQQIETLLNRTGPVLLAFARGVPVLAEASVLWMGLHGLSWRLFLPPVLLGNLVLAIAYCLLGDLAQQHAWLPTALAASAALPIGLLGMAKHWLQKHESPSER